jgi:hypothetical protein
MMKTTIDCFGSSNSSWQSGSSRKGARHGDAIDSTDRPSLRELPSSASASRAAIMYMRPVCLTQVLGRPGWVFGRARRCKSRQPLAHSEQGWGAELTLPV